MRAKGGMSPGCLVLFGAPFALAGAAVLMSVARSWHIYLRSGSWVRVPAQIVQVELVRSRGDEVDTWSVRAAYQYEYGGSAYAGHRVSSDTRKSSDYELHNKRYRTLEEHRASGRPFMAYVNPEEPTESLLFRSIDPWMWIGIPFGLSFVGVGCLVTGMGIASAVRSRRMRAFVQAEGDKLWLVRSDWRRFRCTASNAKELLTAWGIGVGLAVFISTFIVAFLTGKAPLFAIIIVGVFALVAAALLLRAAALTVRQVLYRTPVLFLREVPIVPGRSVPAAIRTARPVPARDWKLSLICEEAKSVQTGGGNELRTRTVFRQQVRPSGDVAPSRDGGVIVPLVIQVPEGTRGTQMGQDQSVTWKLVATAKAFPVSFTASFALPVFYAGEEEVQQAP